MAFLKWNVMERFFVSETIFFVRNPTDGENQHLWQGLSYQAVWMLAYKQIEKQGPGSCYRQLLIPSFLVT